MTKKETKSLLIRARALINEGWCQGNNARTAGGFPTDPNSLLADKFCISGSLIRASNNSFDSYCKAKNAIVEILPYKNISRNDNPNSGSQPVSKIRNMVLSNDDPSTTKEMVLSWFDLAIKSCQD